jgi:hypothetical protein
MRAAHAGWLVALAILVPGCGKDEKPKDAGTTAAKPATVAEKPPPKPRKPARKPPEYKPAGYHKHRARGVIYKDEEIGENVLSAPYDRIIELFGPPAVRKGKCIRYRILARPKGHSWEFCFKGQKMTGASVEPGYQ